MIVDASETYLVSSLGWADQGALWIYDTVRNDSRRVPLSAAEYLSIHAGTNDFFAVVHHFDNNRLDITAHSFHAPDNAVSKISLVNDTVLFEGEHVAWENVPHAYVEYFTRLGRDDYYLILIDAAQRKVDLQQLPWYDDSYDKGYQGVVGVTEVPGKHLVIVSVQRDSEPVLYDPAERRAVQKLTLASRGGNPTLRFLRTAAELWADDYDTLLRLDARNWSVVNAARLQDAAQGTQQFIGNFTFNKDESLCAVARPFSGDVVALNTRTFKVTHHAKLGQQPLKAALLSDGRVFARDWKSGELLQGELKRKLF